jgi:hypothetical protein
MPGAVARLQKWPKSSQRDPEQLCLSFTELTDDTIVY